MRQAMPFMPVCPHGSHGRGGGAWLALPWLDRFAGMVHFEGAHLARSTDRYFDCAGCDCVDYVITFKRSNAFGGTNDQT